MRAAKDRFDSRNCECVVLVMQQLIEDRDAGGVAFGEELLVGVQFDGSQA